MDVLIFQAGYSPCLRHCIESIRAYSPQSRIVILGNNIPDFPFIEETLFHERWAQLEPVYEHFSPNSPEFEKCCLRRWLVAAEYIRTTDIEQYVCIDSDVMVFTELSTALKSPTSSDFYSGHPSFAWVRERRGMERLAEHILWLYQNKDGDPWKAMLDAYTERRRAVVGDMSVLPWFMGKRPDLGLTSPHGRGDVFDRNICETHLFLADGDRKRICFWDGRPYAMTEDRRIVQMNTLHFWGPYKGQMDEALRLARYSAGKPEPIPWRAMPLT